MESESFRGKSAGDFILSSLNHGSRQFPREGEIRSSMGNNFIYPGRGREPKFNRSHIFLSIIFADFIQRKNGKKKKGEKPGGGFFFLKQHLSNNGGLSVGGFNGSFLKWAKGEKNSRV